MKRNKYIISVYNNRTGEEKRWMQGYGNNASAVKRAMKFSKLDTYWERFDYLYSTIELRKKRSVTIENYWTKVIIERV